jgi:hypothetical protein
VRVSLIVRQTREVFRYPAGKEWGPYADMGDALARKQALQRKGGDGKIVFTPEPPCALKRPDTEWEV